MTTFKSWFTGFGGADIGAKAAGLAHLPGREYDPAIAAVSAFNGFPSVVGDVRDADCTGEETPWWFHFSPSCKRASTANVNAGEASEDVEVAQACVRAIVALRPPFVSVENVRAYEAFQAFRLIVRCLMDEGYNVAWWILNSADYGGWTRCAVHANDVEKSWARETAPDIVKASAMMPPVAQAQILAWDVVEKLAQTTQLDTAVNAIWQGLGAKTKRARKTTDGKAAAFLTIEAISKFVSMGSTFESIELLLNECLGDHFMKMRWYTTSMETRQITLNLICKSFLATANTCRTTTHNDAELHDCPLCTFSGVPQTRERLFLVASRVAQVRLPIATHAKTPPHDAQMSLFGDAPLQRWNGWYDAIADLLPGLPDTELAEWQKKFLPDELKTMLIDGKANMYGSSVTMRDEDSPAFTIPVSNSALHGVKAVLVDGTRQVTGVVTREGDEPANVITATTGYKRPSKALLIESQQHNRPPSFREQDEPSVVVAGATSPSRWRAVMIDSSNSERNGKSSRNDDEPSITVVANNNHKAVLATDPPPYRIVKLTPRCLARFQAFPDWYVLPDKVRLACLGIGNAVPPTMMQVLIEAQSAALQEAA